MGIANALSGRIFAKDMRNRWPTGQHRGDGGFRMNTRRSLEKASAMPIAFLSQLPRWLAPIVLAALFVAGAVARGWIGAVALFLVAAFVAWLASLSWPALRLPGRLLRVLIVTLLIAFALWQGSR
jgi:hypothetical protein